MVLRVVWKSNDKFETVEFKHLTFIKGIMSVISIDNKLYTYDMEEIKELEMRESWND